MIEHDQDDIARFMKLVDKLPCGCWFWAGARSRGKGNRKWYGTFYVKGRRVRAHKFACEVLGRKGPLPKGWHRDHTCSFSLCVNFECMEYVTHEENQARKVARRDSVKEAECDPAQPVSAASEEGPVLSTRLLSQVLGNCQAAEIPVATISAASSSLVWC